MDMVMIDHRMDNIQDYKMDDISGNKMDNIQDHKMDNIPDHKMDGIQDHVTASQSLPATLLQLHRKSYRHFTCPQCHRSLSRLSELRWVPEPPFPSLIDYICLQDFSTTEST